MRINVFVFPREIQKINKRGSQNKLRGGGGFQKSTLECSLIVLGKIQFSRLLFQVRKWKNNCASFDFIRRKST